MRSVRKPLIGIAAVLGVIIVLLAIVPYFFRDRIAQRVRAEVAASVNADVRWSGVSIGLLRHFPNVTLGLNDLSVVNGTPFAGDTLVAVRQFRVVLGLGSVIGYLTNGSPIVVRQLIVQQPVAHLRVLQDGTANWDIMRSRPSTPQRAGSRTLAVSLRQFAVNDAAITFDSRQSDLTAALSALDVALNGDFTQSHFALGTRVSAGDASVRFGGIPYLDHAAVRLGTDVDADMRAKRFTFNKAKLQLNQLALALDGSVARAGKNTDLDLSFSSPSTDIGGILSLVPALYARDFDKVQTAGKMAVSGTVKGAYGPNAFPGLALHATVDNGSFRYPDLPLPARDIGLDLSVDNPGGSVDGTVVTLRRFHVVLGQRPLDAQLTLSTPVSDPEVSLAMKGSVDLADVARTVKLPNVQQLAGLVSADFAVHTRKSWVDAGRYNQVSASGTFATSRVAISGDAVPHPVTVDSALLRFTPRRVELPAFVARVGSSDVRATGSLENLIGFLLHHGALQGEATVASNEFNLDEWRSGQQSQIIPVPADVDFTLGVTARRLSYGKLDIRDAHGQVLVKDRRVTLNGFGMHTLGGTVVANGYYETTTPAQPTFAFNVNVDSVDIPQAFSSLLTVQRLAPIARYARGRFTSTLSLSGPLAADMMPVFTKLTGQGSMQTGTIAIDSFPPLTKLADAIHVEQLRNPALQALLAKFNIDRGRLYVKPFDVKVGDMAMTVSGSNGIDQTLDYTLALALPTSMLGSSATQAIGALASAAGRAGLNLASAPAVSVGVQVTGTITNPTVRPSFAGTGSSVEAGVHAAATQLVQTQVAGAQAKVDSTALEARRRASAQAQALVAQAEQQAAAIRAAADSAAAKVRHTADDQAKALVDKATNPVLRVAAQAGADKLRTTADQQAADILRRANARADSVVADARKRAAAIAPPDSR
ncbi:MAG TPA: AsmA-like C-terminal region-containing protein [Gemmatimonadaceae bacterium]|nr:AsmA-like C-terminal region-containing protein [Gemmatimonadaceae bacterium]